MDQQINLNSKKWFWAGVLIALLNPVFAGLIVGAIYLTEPQLKKTGIIVAGISIIWGAALFFMFRQNFLNYL